MWVEDRRGKQTWMTAGEKRAGARGGRGKVITVSANHGTVQQAKPSCRLLCGKPGFASERESKSIDLSSVSAHNSLTDPDAHIPDPFPLSAFLRFANGERGLGRLGIAH